MMNKNRHVDAIVRTYSPALQNGQETIDSILGKYPQLVNELRSPLEAIIWLGKAKKNLEPRPGFISSSRSNLESNIASLPHQSVWQRMLKKYTPRRWVFNITAPILLVIMLALLINSLVLTARLSIPGDPFYSTKLVIENTQLAFTSNPVDKTELYVQFSRERTTEFVELVLDGDYELLPSAANRMETELIASLHSLNNASLRNPNAELPMIASFRETLSNEIFMLCVLKDTSPSSARAGIDLAIQVAQSGMMALR
jgi:hypothetical protein